jgi:acetyltransferase-like isoleucine patch superfamily enzyme
MRDRRLFTLIIVILFGGFIINLVKAFKEIGLKNAVRYLCLTFVYIIFKMAVFPQIRVLFLRLLGAHIGKNCIIHNVSFINYYRGPFSNLRIGNDCFLGGGVLLDLASKIELEDQVTLSERVMILTHLNVGYKDHPLQKNFPSRNGPVKIQRGTYVGAQSVILDSVTIGEKCMVGASSLVNESIPALSVAVGNPARCIRSLQDQ